MIDRLRARFLPRFLEQAHARLRRVEELLAGPNPLAGAAAELHALAGEAAMLELGPVADAARAGEIAARRDDQASCRRAVADLAGRLAALAPPPARPPGT